MTGEGKRQPRRVRLTPADVTSQIAVTVKQVKAWKEGPPDDLGCSPEVAVDVLWKGPQPFFYTDGGQVFEAVLAEVDPSDNARNFRPGVPGD